MVSKGNQDVIPIFWIRLFGVLADIGDDINHHIATLQGTPDPGDFGRKALQDLLPCQKAVKDLRDDFREDELVWIQYRRHCDSHPLQNAYRIRLRRKTGGIQDQVTHRLLGACFTVEEIKSILKRVLCEYDSDEKLLARRFAERALPGVKQLRQASVLWFGEATVAHKLSN